MQIVLRVKDDGTAVIEKFGDTAEREGEKASLSWGKVGAAAGLAAAAAITAAAAMVKSAIDTAEATGNTAQKLGITTEALSGLVYTAKLANVDSQSLTLSLQMMTRNLSDAADKTGPAVDAIKDLHLNAADLAKMGPEKAVEAIADAMEKIPNQADRVSIAMDIFGRSGADMVNVLKGGKEALRTSAEEAAKFGAVISSDAARNADAFNDNIDRLKAAAGGMANTMAAQMLPALVGITDAMVDTAKNSGLLESAAKALGVTLQALTIVGIGVANAFQQTGTWIGAGAAAAVAASKGEFTQAREIIRLAYDDIQKMNAEAAASIAKVWSGEAPAAKPAERPNDNSAPTRSKSARAETEKLKEELAKQLVAIHEATTSEDQLRAEHYVKDFAALQQSLSLKLITQQQYEEQRQALADTYEQQATERQNRESAQGLANIAANIAAMQDSFATQSQIEQAAYEQKLADLENYKLSELYVEQTYADLKANIEKEHQDKKAAITLSGLSTREQQEKASSDKNVKMWSSGYRGQLDVIGGVMSQAANLMQSGSKKQFEIGKKAAIASTLISTFQSAMSAFNSLSAIPIVGPALGAVAAAAAIAFGMSQVAKIRSQQFQGGGAGGGSVPTFSANPNTGLPTGTPGGDVGLPSDALPPSPTAAPVQPRQVNIYLQGEGAPSDAYTRDYLIPAINKASGDGVTINVRSV